MRGLLVVPVDVQLARTYFVHIQVTLINLF